MSKNILLEQVPTTPTAARNMGYKTTEDAAMRSGGCNSEDLTSVVIQQTTYFKCKTTKSGQTSSSDTTDTTGQSSTPKPSVTPIPIKDWMKSKTGQTKTTTSQYKRCENASIQKKWCVSELIKKAQVCLKEVGYDLGTSGVNRDGVDGYWGEKTDAALRAVGFGSGIDKQAVEVICNTADRVVKDRVAKQLKDKADQEYRQKYGSMERAAETDYLYFGDTTSGGGDEEASGEGMEGETLFFNN